MDVARELPFGGQIMLRDVEFDSGYDVLDGLEQTENVDEANAITSKVAKAGGIRPLDEEVHKPILDIDFPVHVVPSSTPGHSHVYIDKAMPWDKLKALLDALADAGVVERGYADASIDQGFTTVRAPWVKKTEPSDLPVPRCVGCHKRPHDFSTYRFMVEEEGYADADEAVRRNEGTYNRENGHFWCDGCYIRAGQPLGKAA